MKILSEKITKTELAEMSKKMFGNMVKAVADIARGKMAIDGELHSDLAELLIEDGSKGQNIWGFNIYPELEPPEWIEFDSMVNLKPLLDNRTRNVENLEIQKKILAIVNNFIAP
mgnify:CR=1 FL=1